MAPNRPKHGENWGLELRRQVWVLRYKLAIIFIENHSLKSVSGVALVQRRTDPVALQERTTAEAEGTETELSERENVQGWKPRAGFRKERD